MRATISVALFNKDNVTQQFVRSLEQCQLDDVEFIFINNGSTDHTEHVIFTSRLKNKVYIPMGINTGFPYAHNKALQIARGEYFVVLNNDLIFQDRLWLDKLLGPLKDVSVAIVGLDNSPCQLRQDGTGFYGLQKDYVEGSCVAGRTDFFRQYGLFSESYRMFFYEDSDLGLRVRQAGFKIRHASIAHQHARSQSFSGVSQEEKVKALEHNKRIFHARWAKYLNMREFSNNILVKSFSAGIGDIVACTPVLEGIRKDHPTANIELETNAPEVFFNNPYINGVFNVRKSYDKGYDRVIDLGIDYARYDLIGQMAIDVAATTVKSLKPQLFLSGHELEHGKEIIDEVSENGEYGVMGVNLHLKRANWAGRNWNIKHAKELVKRMREELGVKIIELGQGVPSTGEADLDLIDQTTLRELFAIMSQLDYFVCIDSLPFHVAQAFSIPTFVLMGAVAPISRVVDFTTTFPIRNEHLDCIGCYQRRCQNGFNFCVRNDQECMQSITSDLVMAYLTNEINPLESNIRYLQTVGRQLYANKC